MNINYILTKTSKYWVRALILFGFNILVTGCGLPSGSKVIMDFDARSFSDVSLPHELVETSVKISKCYIRKEIEASEEGINVMMTNITYQTLYGPDKTCATPANFYSEWQTKLASTLYESGIFAPTSTTSVRLEAEVEHLATPAVAITFDTHLVVNYRLSDVYTGEELFNEGFVSKGSADMGDSILGETRIDLSRSRAVSNNTKKLMEYINTWLSDNKNQH